MKILLAIDGSAHSKATVDEVARRPFPPKTKVRVVTVYEKIHRTMIMDPIGAAPDYYAKADGQALKVAESTAQNAANILRRKNVRLSITTSVVEGVPKIAILQEAETFRADLIVLGSHGYGAVERFL